MSRTIRKSRRGKIYRDGHSKWENFPHSTPKEWRHRYMTIPRRRENTKICKWVMECGTDLLDYYIDPFYPVEMKGYNHEEAAWPLGNHKPHTYYW